MIVMETTLIIAELKRNKEVFNSLLKGHRRDLYSWKPAPEKWCLLEIVCHLYDEEREDFRSRVKHILEQPNKPMPPIHPQEWVSERKYLDWDFELTLTRFLAERDESIAWLEGLKGAPWGNCYQHPKVGPISAKMILTNWAAHDLLHIRQITATKYKYLDSSGEDLGYAGTW